MQGTETSGGIFGRPSDVWILKDDALAVSDSESNQRIGGEDDAPEPEDQPGDVPELESEPASTP